MNEESNQEESGGHRRVHPLIIGKYTLEGGGSCPEQYDVMLDGQEVGYLRLRHGNFTADCPFGNTVHQATPNGDGRFEDSEREEYLTKAIAAIDKELNKNMNKLTDTEIVDFLASLWDSQMMGEVEILGQKFSNLTGSFRDAIKAKMKECYETN